MKFSSKVLIAIHLIVGVVLSQDESTRAFWDDGQGPTFIPIEPVEEFFADSPIRLEIVANDQSDISEVSLYYKFSPTKGYTKLKMELDVNYTAEIPAENVVAGKLYYYFWARDAFGNQSAWPEDGEDNPLVLPVLGQLGRFSYDKLPVVLISPDPDEEGDGFQILIVSLYDPEETINLSSIRVLINGMDITPFASITREIITYVPPDAFDPGIHSVQFQLVDEAGVAFEKRFSFSIIQEEVLVAEAEKPSWRERLRFKGNISIDTDYDSFSGKPQPDNRPIDLHKINIKAKFILGPFKFNASVLLNTHIIDKNAIENDKRRQPLDRLKFDIRSKYLDLYYGDYSPEFSEFTLKGTRVRGLTSQLKLGWWKTTYIQGETKQLIQSENYVNPDSINWTPVSLPFGDSTYVNHIRGTATRSLQGIRTEVDFFRHINIGISGFKAFDDDASLDLPYEELQDKYTFLGNLVGGMDITFHFNNDKTSLSLETALSVLNDISFGDSLLIEEAGLDSTLLTNIENVLGFPITDDLILGSAEGRGLSIPFPDPDSLSSPSQLLDYFLNDAIRKGTYRIEFKSPISFGFQRKGKRTGTTIDIRAEYKRVPANFASLGNSSIQTDIQGIKSGARWRLFKNQISLSGGYENTFDNVAGNTKPQTTTTETRSGSIGFSFRKLPMITYSIRIMDRTGALPEGIEDTDITLVLNNNTTVTHTISPAYKLTLKGVNLSINGNIMNMTYADSNATPEANTNFQTSSYTGTAAIGFSFLPLSLSFGGGNSTNTPEDLTQSETVFNVLSGKLSYKLLNKKLNTFIGFNMVKGSKNKNGVWDSGEAETEEEWTPDDDLIEIDNKKFTFKIGAQYKIARNIGFWVNIYHISVNDFIDTSKNYSELRGKLKIKIGF